jgi:hypothetical protein
MTEIGKFRRIHCHEAHKKWPALLPHIERWLNGTISDSTGYSRTELMCGEDRPDLFKDILEKAPENKIPTETIQNKIAKAHVRMRSGAAKRNNVRLGTAEVLMLCTPMESGFDSPKPRAGDLSRSCECASRV